MTFNQKMITDYAEQYKNIYKNQFGENPTSWFTFFQWLSSFSSAGSFDNDDVKLAEKLLGVK